MTRRAPVGTALADESPVTHRVIANLGRALAVAPLHESVPDGRALRRKEVLDSPLPMPSLAQAMPLRQLPLIVCGDRVRVETDAAGAVRATRLAPRDTVLERTDQRGRFKPLAANLTHLGIVAAAPPGIDTLLVDQFCVAAERAGLEPIVIINKIDLLDEPERRAADALLDSYRDAGYPALASDAKRLDGLDTLRQALIGRVAALVGASGVGKSSIVQALLPDREVRVGAVSAATGLGSHTTSVTWWYELPDGGAIVDSPGVRQYAVDELTPREVRTGFREIAVAAEACRFNDCSHVVEPGCAVREALEAGHIAAFRYANYLKLSKLGKFGKTGAP